ncbi:hypothetical protein [Piscinibacter sp. HJYY11]|uniref:hypothetical protein n=1 Tax=Piscinibacter sp. HJYY11 TaxID=2801333 RepID=UPI00191FF30F|nr:hypothetical protein [Piscinibacter sp. HJYY11]MBL0730622.1 hypothetical protein [Piscinibacter sp. HJYY11]
MRIEIRGEDELEQALREIHRRALAYEGPLMHEFMELANLSAPVEPDEPLGEGLVVAGQGVRNASPANRREIKGRFEEALSLLMVLAFPVNSRTEQAVRRELNETLEHDQQVKSMQMLVGNRKTSLKRNLGRRPTRQQVALRQAFLDFLPRQTEVDL